MQLQFQCPACQTVLQSESGSSLMEAQCPKCSTRFMVDPRTAFMPTVAAVAALSPQQLRKQARAEREAAEKRKMVLMLGGSVFLLASVCLVAFTLERPEKAEEKWQQGKAGSALVQARVEDEEVKLVEEAEAQKVAAEQREIMARLEREERAERARRRRILVVALSREVFNGDESAAEAMVVAVEAVEQEVLSLFNDGIAGNEPTTPRELEQMFISRLLPKLVADPVIVRAAKRMPAEEMARLLLRRAAPGEGPGAKVPEVFRSGKYNSTGTAFWISADGWLITNHHVVNDRKTVDLRLADGKVVSARVEVTDETNDLALLKAETKPAAWLPVSKGEKELGLGQMVFTIGYPNALVQGVEPKFTDGKISSRSGMNDSQSFYQTSVPVQPGNSGGPLVDYGSGWVVGVMSQRLERSTDGRSAQSVSYAVKGSILSGFIKRSASASAACASQSPPALKAGDAQAITERARQATALVLVGAGK